MKKVMFEHRSKPLLPSPEFIKRMVFFSMLSAGFVIFSLLLGMIGYRILENFSCVDAFVNAAMILSGMGPLAQMHTDDGKIFAGCYALYSGLALITIAAIIFAPLVHRFLHKFHLETKQ